MRKKHVQRMEKSKKREKRTDACILLKRVTNTQKLKGKGVVKEKKGVRRKNRYEGVKRRDQRVGMIKRIGMIRLKRRKCVRNC